MLTLNNNHFERAFCPTPQMFPLTSVTYFSMSSPCKQPFLFPHRSLWACLVRTSCLLHLSLRFYLLSWSLPMKANWLLIFQILPSLWCSQIFCSPNQSQDPLCVFSSIVNHLLCIKEYILEKKKTCVVSSSIYRLIIFPLNKKWRE